MLAPLSAAKDGVAVRCRQRSLAAKKAEALGTYL